MNRTNRIIMGIALLAVAAIAAPRPSRAQEWLPIAPEDLAMKDNPKQPGLDSMILYRQLDDDASKAPTSGDTLEEYMRIKIFTQDGVKRGHVQIEFVKEYQNVVMITGRTIRPDGTIVKFDGQVLETTLEKSSGLKVLAKTFTLPDVQPGCIVEYRYQLQGQPGWAHSHEWTVSQPMYTREAHFTYRPFQGYGNSLRPMVTTYLLPADATPKEQADGKYLMVVHDISAVVEEPLMPPRRPIESRVAFYYQDLDSPSATDPSDHYWNHYAKKWNDQLEKFIDKKKSLNEEVSKIVSPSDAPEVKLRKIYARVQQIRNLSFEDYKMQKEDKTENLKPNLNVEDVLTRGYGYGRDIDYLFVGLARAAGFEATEVYIAPRNVGIFLPKRNEVGELSDEFTWVGAGSKEYYLDPSARFFPFGLLPWYETESGGIKVDKNGATMVTTPIPAPVDATLARSADLDLRDDGSISGTVRLDLEGQRAALLREEKRKEDETGRTKDLEGDVKDWLPAGATFEITKIANWDNTDQPIHIEATVNIPSFAMGAAQRMVMPLEIFQMSQMAEFASERRVNAVYFHYPYEETDDIKLRLPPGYRAESLPPDRKMNLGAVSYDISATAQEGVVEVKRSLAVNSVLFTKEEYSTLRKFFGAVKTSDNTQMVLQNAASAKNN
jgi:transglutaminase-like putative cysteine protease